MSNMYIGVGIQRDMFISYRDNERHGQRHRDKDTETVTGVETC